MPAHEGRQNALDGFAHFNHSFPWDDKVVVGLSIVRLNYTPARLKKKTPPTGGGKSRL